MNMAWIRHQVIAHIYHISPHALKECVEEAITLEELDCALLNGQILEHYGSRNDPRGDRCLVLGYRPQADALHVVVAQDRDGLMNIVTAYLPKPPEWLNDKSRGLI